MRNFVLSLARIEVVLDKVTERSYFLNQRRERGEGEGRQGKGRRGHKWGREGRRERRHQEAGGRCERGPREEQRRVKVEDY